MLDLNLHGPNEKFSLADFHHARGDLVSPPGSESFRKRAGGVEVHKPDW
jgi:hypothetical protein